MQFLLHHWSVACALIEWHVCCGGPGGPGSGGSAEQLVLSSHSSLELKLRRGREGGRGHGPLPEWE